MEDNLNFKVDGGQPQFVLEKCEMTSSLWQNGRKLNFLNKIKDNLKFGKLEDDLNLFAK
jgi:hypothetical protein